MKDSMFHSECFHNVRVEYWEGKCDELSARALDDIESRVWAIARESVEPPHLGNLYSGCLLDTLEALLMDNYGGQLEDSFDRFVNGWDTHFYINRIAVYSDEDLATALRSLGIEP